MKASGRRQCSVGFFCKKTVPGRIARLKSKQEVLGRTNKPTFPTSASSKQYSMPSPPHKSHPNPTIGSKVAPTSEV
jgi:hypothetical protein